MKIIVDVYNVLKYFLGKPRVSVPEREKFISMISAYAEKKKNKVILVFDGGELPYPFESKVGRVVVIESGYDLSADDVIKDLLELSPRETTVLVSSDGELVRFADILGIASMGSIVFFDLINRAVSEAKPSISESRIKTPQTNKIDYNSEDIDYIMRQSSKHIVYKDEDIKLKSGRKFSNKIRSKADKKLLKIIDKL